MLDDPVSIGIFALACFAVAAASAFEPSTWKWGLRRMADRGERRFAFGRNWLRFLEHVDEGRVGHAMEAVAEMACADRLDGMRFLDVGCGSGLSSLAAHRLGAEVVARPRRRDLEAADRGGRRRGRARWWAAHPPGRHPRAGAGRGRLERAPGGRSGKTVGPNGAYRADRQIQYSVTRQRRIACLGPRFASRNDHRIRFERSLA